MRVRALDSNNDWEYGKGQNDYKTANLAIGQNIQTRLSSFLGDCFFDTGAGIDWFGFLGFKDELSLNLAISATILNTSGVLGLVQLSSKLDPSTRNFRVVYSVNTIYTKIPNAINLVTGAINFLLTEAGDIITTESGSGLELE